MKTKFLLCLLFITFISVSGYSQDIDEKTSTTNISSNNEEVLVNESTENIIFEVKKRNYGEEKNEEKGDVTPIVEPSVAEEKPVPKKQGFLDKGRTGFAFGIDISAGAANSYFTLKDFLFNPKGTVEVDFNKMSKILPSTTGFSLSALSNFKIYFEIYIKSKAEFGLFTTADVYAFGSIPKNLIDLIAKGNKDNDKLLSGKFTAMGSVFAGTGLFYGMTIKSFKFRASGAYFIPVLYVPYDGLDYEFSNGPDGKITVKAGGGLKIYTPLPIFQRNNNFDIPSLFKQGGFDISFEGSYKFKSLANLNFSLTHIPVYPAVMDKGAIAKFSTGYEIASAFEYLNAFINGTPMPGMKEDPVEMKISSDGTIEKRYVLRPIKLNVGADIYPFLNNYLIISPNIGCHCMKPFYVDAGIKLETRLLKVFGFYYSLAREDIIWKNRGGFFFDARLFRFETSVTSSSPSFVGSFKGAGVEVGLGLVFGY